MIHALDPLREFTFLSALCRLLLAMLCGGVIGYGRSRQARPAGLRTYILISIGAAMGVLVSLYLYRLSPWDKFDASRLASQVVAGIGFLGAGTILKAAHQQVSGLTTATGLFATVCLSMAAGAGFYELAILSVLIAEVVLNLMSPLEVRFKRRLRNITLNVEFESVEDIAAISEAIRSYHASVYEVDVERSE